MASFAFDTAQHVSAVPSAISALTFASLAGIILLASKCNNVPFIITIVRGDNKRTALGTMHPKLKLCAGDYMLYMPGRVGHSTYLPVPQYRQNTDTRPQPLACKVAHANVESSKGAEVPYESRAPTLP